MAESERMLNNPKLKSAWSLLGEAALTLADLARLASTPWSTLLLDILGGGEIKTRRS